MGSAICGPRAADFIEGRELGFTPQVPSWPAQRRPYSPRSGNDSSISRVFGVFCTRDAGDVIGNFPRLFKKSVSKDHLAANTTIRRIEHRRAPRWVQGQSGYIAAAPA